MSAASPDAILHLTTLHLLSQAGFASTSQAASLTLSTAASKYLHLVARICVERATLAGRSKPSAGDVLSSLGEMGEDVDSLWGYLVGPVDDDEGEGEVAGGLRWRGGMEGLDEWLSAGKGVGGAIAEMRIMQDDELPEDVESEDDAMDVDVDPPNGVSHSNKRTGLGKENDPMSWLPPLPGHTPPPVHTSLPSLPTIDLTSPTAQSAPLPQTAPNIAAAPQSICDRYRHSIPYASSQLSSKAWVDPLPPLQPRPPHTQTSSFPALLDAYKATATEPSVTLPQTDLRRQAAEIVRRSIAPADKWIPKDTLVQDIPGPRVSPFAPSHSEDEKVQPHLIPINSDPTGLLGSLVHQIHSPHLPAALRTRLTGLRPPLPQKDKDGNSIFYGPRVRAPDSAAREKFKGKQVDPSEETYLRYTWDSGPRGADKWGSARLPSGKKVIASGEGEDVPRQPGKEASKLRIKIERGNSILGGGLASAGASTASISPGVGAGGAGGEAGGPPPDAMGQRPSMKITLGQPKRPSVSPSPTAPIASPGGRPSINGSPFVHDGISPKSEYTARQATPPTIPSPPVNGDSAGAAAGGAVARPGGIKIRIGSHRMSFGSASGDGGGGSVAGASMSPEGSVTPEVARPKIRLSTSGINMPKPS